MAKEWTKGFYTSKQWRKVRDAYYKEQCGNCERCMKEYREGKRSLAEINPGVIVHHKISLTPENINNPSISLSFSNLELLCAEHHNQHHKKKIKARYRIGKDGRIIEN